MRKTEAGEAYMIFFLEIAELERVRDWTGTLGPLIPDPQPTTPGYFRAYTHL